MVKLTGSRSTLSRIAMTLLLLFSVSVLFYPQLQSAPMGASTSTSFAFSLFSPSSSPAIVLAQPSDKGNTTIGNSNNDSANTTTMQPMSNQSGNNTNTTKWVSLGPIPQVTQSNETANNSIAATADTGTDASDNGVEMAADPAVLQQTSKVPITKEEAIRAEQEAKIMIEDYYEKVEQEKREQAAALAAAQANQTTQATDAIEGSEDGITAASDETETESEDDEEEDQDDEEGDENENGDEEEG